jgi:transcriptional accessory protein Tex/SPT6
MIDLNMSIEAESDEKIREALRCMRKELFEVPFIAFYRKEAINLTGRSEACLSLTDLWKIYLYDEKVLGIF